MSMSLAFCWDTCCCRPPIHPGKAEHIASGLMNFTEPTNCLQNLQTEISILSITRLINFLHCICTNSTLNSWKWLVTSQASTSATRILTNQHRSTASHDHSRLAVYPFSCMILHTNPDQDKRREPSQKRFQAHQSFLFYVTNRYSEVEYQHRLFLSSGKFGSEKNQLSRTPPLTDNFLLEQTAAIDRTFSRK